MTIITEEQKRLDLINLEHLVKSDWLGILIKHRSHQHRIGGA